MARKRKADLHAEVLAETTGPAWVLEIEPLLSECNFPMVRIRTERLDDAAWYGVPARER